MDLFQDKDYQQNMMQFATMFAFSHSFSSNDRVFQLGAIYTLIGFTVYHAIVKKLDLNEFKGPKKAMVDTWLKVGTMLVVSQSLKGGELDEEFLMSSLFTLVGFNISDLFGDQYIPKVENPIAQNMINSASVVGTMSVVSQLLNGGKFDRKFFMSSGSTVAGFMIYDLIAGLN
jgi:hypothetical protein